MLHQQLGKMLGNCSNRFFQCGNHPTFQYTMYIKKYDEDLYRFFLNVKHEGQHQDKLFWYREGVMYSGIKSVISTCAWGGHPVIVCPRKVYSFNVWRYPEDTVETKYLKVYGMAHVFYVFIFTITCSRKTTQC